MASFQAPPDGGYPPGWYPDPWGRAEFRYWDGRSWSQHVSTGGAQSVDVAPPPAPQQASVQAAGADATTAQPPSISTNSTPRAAEHTGVPLFGARGRARELASEVTELRAEVQRLSRLDVLTVA